MKLSSRIANAESLGLIAFEQGNITAPAQCNTTMEMIKGEERKNTIKILEAWNKGYQKAKRAKIKAFLVVKAQTPSAH